MRSGRVVLGFGIRLSQPGAERQTTCEEWLEKRAAVP